MKATARHIGLLLTLGFFVAACGGCAGIPKTTREVARLTGPPPGKALVNFHRPSNYGGGRAFAIFSGQGKMLIDLPGASLFQLVCEPGEQVFLGWADHVTVVKADLAADKTYDIVVDVGMGWVQASLTLDPLTKENPRRPKVAQFEKREKRTLGLSDSPRIAKYEADNQGRVQEILKDFIGGPKSDRVRNLRRDDCR